VVLGDCWHGDGACCLRTLFLGKTAAHASSWFWLL
jgi:hypothetical protein